MKSFPFALLTFLTVTAVTPYCLQAQIDNTYSEPDTVIWITPDVELDVYVGKVVSVVGMVSNTKIAQIHGVDIASDKPDVRGKMAMAFGRLEKTVVTARGDGIIEAGRGPGSYYSLRDPETGELVSAKRLRR